MGGYANARAFLGEARVRRENVPHDRPQVIGGVPFQIAGVNAEGHDHIDVGRSLYRQANLEGYMPSYEHRWIGNSRRDPAHPVALPQDSYDASICWRRRISARTMSPW